MGREAYHPNSLASKIALFWIKNNDSAFFVANHGKN